MSIKAVNWLYFRIIIKDKRIFILIILEKNLFFYFLDSFSLLLLTWMKICLEFVRRMIIATVNYYLFPIKEKIEWWE